MIESIKLKNVASFDQNGVIIEDLKKVNFFFGFNGSGKSTIAKYLNSIENQISDSENIYSDCSSTGFDQASQRILLFNETFIEDNFVRNSELKGIFSLNSANDKIDKQINLKGEKLREINLHLKSRKALKEKLQNNLKHKHDQLVEKCWGERNNFSLYSKYSLEHSGNRANSLTKIKSLISNLPDTITTLSQLNSEYLELYERENKFIHNTINPCEYGSVRVVENELNLLMAEIIFGKDDVDIAQLINSLKINTWVQEGVKIIEQTGQKCPFCQKNTIDNKLKEDFSKFFDATFKQKVDKLGLLKGKYEESMLKILSTIEKVEDEFNTSNLVSILYRNLKTLFESNIKIIESKINNPNEIKVIESINSRKDDFILIKREITKSNNISLHLTDRKKEFSEKLWFFLASICKTYVIEYEKLKDKYERIIDSINKSIEQMQQNLNNMSKEIEELRSQTVNTKQAVDDINTILSNTGYYGFQIVEKESKNNISLYYLKRSEDTKNNSVFKSLSEGEKRFITFLYFFQLCIGSDNIDQSVKKKIIVIDDPVSSLDSQALFVVSTLIHSLIRQKGNTKTEKKLLYNSNIEQVFIFTHNLYFYKEVSLDKRPMCTSFWHFYISKPNKSSVVEGSDNRKIFDEYSLMWNSLKNLKASIANDPSQNIVISNIMRRLLESYVNFLGLGKDSWASLFDDNIDDPTFYIKSAFISGINDDSHKVSVLDDIYYYKITTEQPQRLFSVFAEIFKSIGKDHYKLMMSEELP